MPRIVDNTFIELLNTSCGYHTLSMATSTKLNQLSKDIQVTDTQSTPELTDTQRYATLQAQLLTLSGDLFLAGLITEAQQKQLHAMYFRGNRILANKALHSTTRALNSQSCSPNSQLSFEDNQYSLPALVAAQTQVTDALTEAQ